jgi:hypothetical protein
MSVSLKKLVLKIYTHTTPIWGDLVLLSHDYNKPSVLIHDARLHL